MPAMPNSGYEQFIYLTAQSDNEQLSKAFMELVVELYPSADIRLYSSKHPATASQFELLYIQKKHSAFSINELIEHDLGKITKLRDTDSAPDVVSQANETLYPLLLRGLWFGALVIHTRQNDELEQITLLTTYIAIYCNQLNLIRTSNHDALTGLFNRQTFDGTLNKLLNQPETQRRSAEQTEPEQDNYFAMLDIDHFKRLNDNFGHLIGDEILLSLAQIMQNTFRSDDMLFRYGGEEFAIIIKKVNHRDCNHILNRFRENIAETLFPQVGQVTISIGFTKIQPGELPPTIIQQADRALYCAKHAGRNRCFSYSELVKQGELSHTISDDSNIELF